MNEKEKFEKRKAKEALFSMQIDAQMSQLNELISSMCIAISGLGKAQSILALHIAKMMLRLVVTGGGATKESQDEHFDLMVRICRLEHAGASGSIIRAFEHFGKDFLLDMNDGNKENYKKFVEFMIKDVEQASSDPIRMKQLESLVSEFGEAVEQNYMKDNFRAS